jgi:hypothetical protein
MKPNEDKKRVKFCTRNLTKKVINDDVSNEQIEKIELTVKYADKIESSTLEDSSLMSLDDWLNNSGLDQNWKLKSAIYPKCSIMVLKLKQKKRFY